MQHDHVLKKYNFDLLTKGQVGEGYVGNIFLTMLLYFVIPFKFDMQHDDVRKKLNFDLLTLRSGGGGGGSAGKIFATMLLYFVIPFNFICNMIMF